MDSGTTHHEFSHFHEMGKRFVMGNTHLLCDSCFVQLYRSNARTWLPHFSYLSSGWRSHLHPIHSIAHPLWHTPCLTTRWQTKAIGHCHPRLAIVTFRIFYILYHNKYSPNIHMVLFSNPNSSNVHHHLDFCHDAACLHTDVDLTFKKSLLPLSPCYNTVKCSPITIPEEFSESYYIFSFLLQLLALLVHNILCYIIISVFDRLLYKKVLQL